MLDTTLTPVQGCAQGRVRSCGLAQGVCTLGTQTCASDGWSACTGYPKALAVSDQGLAAVLSDRLSLFDVSDPAREVYRLGAGCGG